MRYGCYSSIRSAFAAILHQTPKNVNRIIGAYDLTPLDSKKKMWYVLCSTKLGFGRINDSRVRCVFNMHVLPVFLQYVVILAEAGIREKWIPA